LLIGMEAYCYMQNNILREDLISLISQTTTSPLLRNLEFLKHKRKNLNQDSLNQEVTKLSILFPDAQISCKRLEVKVGPLLKSLRDHRSSTKESTETHFHGLIKVMFRMILSSGVQIKRILYLMKSILRR
jgi:hypothetical protein